MFTIQVFDIQTQKWIDVTTVTRADADRFMEESNRHQNQYRIKEDPR
jgi:hypothetical protein